MKREDLATTLARIIVVAIVLIFAPIMWVTYTVMNIWDWFRGKNGLA